MGEKSASRRDRRRANPSGRGRGGSDASRGAPRATPGGASPESAEPAPAQRVTPFRFRHAIVLLDRLLAFEQPADRTLQQYFRANRDLGSSDRAFVAETVYTVLRRLRSAEHLAGGRQPRGLVIATLAATRNLRELAPVLNANEHDLARAARALDRGGLSLAERAELPDWMAERLLSRLGDEDALLRLAAALNRQADLDLRVRGDRAVRDRITEELCAQGHPARATAYSPAGIRIDGRPELQHHPLFLDGTLEVQDEGSQLVACLVQPRPGERVADYCAGAGGKTLALASMMRSRGQVYAFDVSARRLARMRPRLVRSRLSNVHPQRIDGPADVALRRLHGKLDRVLVDAPCSGLGTVRRNPDLKWRWGPEAVAEMRDRQCGILEAASALVREGGRLVYATCSLLCEENEEVVEAFAAAHPDFAVVDAHQVLARQGIEVPRSAPGPWLHLRPDLHGTDGFFVAVFERSRPGAAESHAG